MRGKKRSHWFWRLLKVTLLLVLIAALLVGALAVYLQPACTREEGVVYGRRGSVDLTLDVVTPTAPNGRGILMLMSGSWKSKKGSFKRFLAAPLLRQGFTVFAVYHVSQPEVTIMQIVEDMHRAVRFVRTQAEAYGVDPDHLGVTGASSVSPSFVTTKHQVRASPFSA